jgi:hypothetical protein
VIRAGPRYSSSRLPPLVEPHPPPRLNSSSLYTIEAASTEVFSDEKGYVDLGF